MSLRSHICKCREAMKGSLEAHNVSGYQKWTASLRGLYNKSEQIKLKGTRLLENPNAFLPKHSHATRYILRLQIRKMNVFFLYFCYRWILCYKGAELRPSAGRAGAPQEALTACEPHKWEQAHCSLVLHTDNQLCNDQTNTNSFSCEYSLKVILYMQFLAAQLSLS